MHDANAIQIGGIFGVFVNGEVLSRRPVGDGVARGLQPRLARRCYDARQAHRVGRAEGDNSAGRLSGLNRIDALNGNAIAADGRRNAKRVRQNRRTR